MKSQIKFDVAAMTLTVSQKFWNKASVPFSEEYETIKRILQDYPRCRIEVRKPIPNRNSYTNPTYNSMMLYIERQPNAAELMDEFERIRDFSRSSRMGYNFVRKWFMEKCQMDSQSDSSCCEENHIAAQ